MQSVLIVILCFICKVSILFSAVHEKCCYDLVLYMQSVLIIYCCICKESLLISVLYATCSYYVVLYTQSVDRAGSEFLSAIGLGAERGDCSRGPAAKRAV